MRVLSFILYFLIQRLTIYVLQSWRVQPTHVRMVVLAMITQGVMDECVSVLLLILEAAVRLVSVLCRESQSRDSRPSTVA